MSMRRRRAICTQRAMSAEGSSIGGRASARTTAGASRGSTSSRSQASTSRTSVRSKNACRAEDAAGDRALGERDGDRLALLGDRRARARRSARARRPRARSAARARRRPAAPARARWRRARSGPRRPAAPRTSLPMRGASGATTACAASSTRCGQRKLCASVTTATSRRCSAKRSMLGGAGAARATDRLVVVARGGEARAARLERRDQLALGVASGPASRRRGSPGGARRRARSRRRRCAAARRRRATSAALVVDAALLEHAVVGGEDGGELALALAGGAVERRRPRARGASASTSSARRRSMRRMKLANSASGRPRKSWRASSSSSARSSSIARRSAALTTSTNGSMPSGRRLGREDWRGERRRGVDGELLVRAGERVLDADADRGGRAGGAQHEGAMGRDAARRRGARRGGRAPPSCRCPGPPTTSSGVPRWVTASRCASVSPSRALGIGSREYSRTGLGLMPARGASPRGVVGLRRAAERWTGGSRGARGGGGGDLGLAAWRTPRRRRTGSRRAGGSPPRCARCSPRCRAPRSARSWSARGEGGDRTLVIDQAAEDIVFAELERLHEAGARFVAISEERGEVEFGGGPVRVVIDPIDGSMNAKRGLSPHAVSIAVADGPTMADVVFGFVCELRARRGVDGDARGGGARARRRRRGRRAGAERAAQPRAGCLELVAIEAAHPHARRRGRPGARRASCTACARSGSMAWSLCQLAGGRLDGMATLWRARSVDVAAAQLIVRESGGARRVHGLRGPARGAARPRRRARRWSPRTRPPRSPSWRRCHHQWSDRLESRPADRRGDRRRGRPRGPARGRPRGARAATPRRACAPTRGLVPLTPLPVARDGLAPAVDRRQRALDAPGARPRRRARRRRHGAARPARAGAHARPALGPGRRADRLPGAARARPVRHAAAGLDRRPAPAARRAEPRRRGGAHGGRRRRAAALGDAARADARRAVRLGPVAAAAPRVARARGRRHARGQDRHDQGDAHARAAGTCARSSTRSAAASS